MTVYISPPGRHSTGNPLVRLLAAVAGIAAAVGAFMLGLVALAVILGVGLVFALVFWVRVWWLRRQLRRQGIEPEEMLREAMKPDNGEVIEVEYTVVSREREGPPDSGQ